MQLLAFIGAAAILAILLMGSAVNTIKISQQSDYYIEGEQ